MLKAVQLLMEFFGHFFKIFLSLHLTSNLQEGSSRDNEGRDKEYMLSSKILLYSPIMARDVCLSCLTLNPRKPTWPGQLCNSQNWGHCWLTTRTSDHIIIIITSVKFPLLFLSRKSDQSAEVFRSMVINEAWWNHCPCCGANTTFWISMYSKEYNFPIFVSN
jgi:hypothetical protein